MSSGPSSTYSPDGSGMPYLDNQQMHMRPPGKYFYIYILDN